jgi:hypothetical protein
MRRAPTTGATRSAAALDWRDAVVSTRDAAGRKSFSVKQKQESAYDL